MTRAPARQKLARDADGLISRYYDKVFNLAFRTLGRREDAEDIAQQTFLRALTRLHDLRAPDAAGAWLYRIATNLCFDALRGRQSEGTWLDGDLDDCTPLPDPDRLSTPAQAAELHEERLAVWRAALGLPPEQRLALALREMHGMSYAQIAESMGKSVGAVETLLFRARIAFRRTFAVAPLQKDGPCRSTLELLSASIDGELGRGEQARIDAHVQTCHHCQFAACELRATSRLYALIPLVMPPAAKITVASLLVGSVGGAAGGGALLSTAGVAPTLVSGGVAATAAGGVWSSVGACAVGATVAAVIAVSTVSSTSTPVEATSPPPRVATTVFVADRPQWRVDAVQSPASMSAEQADTPGTNDAPSGTPGPSGVPRSAGAPLSIGTSSEAGQRENTLTATPEAADRMPAHDTAPASDAQGSAALRPPVTPETKHSDAVLSKAQTGSSVAVGLESATHQRPTKATPVVSSPRMPPSAHREQDTDAGPPPKDKGDGNGDANENSHGKGSGVARGTPNSDAAQDDSDQASPEPKGNGQGSAHGPGGSNDSNATEDRAGPKDDGAAPSGPEPKGNGQGSAHGPGASSGDNATQGGPGPKDDDGAAPSGPEPKGHGAGSPPGPGTSNDNTATQGGPGPKGNGATPSAPEPKGNGNGSPPQGAGASNSNGVTQSSTPGTAAAQPAGTPAASGPAKTVKSAQVGKDDHAPSPPPNGSPTPQAKSVTASPTTSVPTRAATPSATPSASQTPTAKRR